MGFTKDLWTKPDRNPDGTIKLDAKGREVRVPNARHGRGKRWLAVWHDPEGKEVTAAFKTSTAAGKHWVKMEADVERGDYHDPKSGKELFGEVAARWLSSRTVDPSTGLRYESIYRLHVQPAFGKRQVKAIKPSDVSKFQAELGERFGVSTVATARLVLVGVLDLALADDLIKKNPALSKAVPPVSSRGGDKVQAWGDERVFALIDAHPESLKLLPIIGASCGLREGELFGLALEDIDFEEGVVHVRRQIKKLGREYVFALPKNDRARIVPLSSWTADRIRAHVKKFKPQPCTLPWEKTTGKPRTHNILFRWSDDRHLTSRAFSQSCWKPALVAAKVIPAPTKGKRGRKVYVTTRQEGTHQLRHYFASVMLADGVNIRELADYLGHADPGFTLRVYAHLLPDSHERARKAIDVRMESTAAALRARHPELAELENQLDSFYSDGT